MNNDSGCLDCTERRPMCHSNCERYLNYRKKLDYINEKRRLIKQEESFDYVRYKRRRSK